MPICRRQSSAGAEGGTVSRKRLDAFEIGRLCQSSALDEVAPVEVSRALPRDRSEAIGVLARIIGELADEIDVRDGRALAR